MCKIAKENGLPEIKFEPLGEMTEQEKIQIKIT
jgi:hypothetical protein